MLFKYENRLKAHVNYCKLLLDYKEAKDIPGVLLGYLTGVSIVDCRTDRYELAHSAWWSHPYSRPNKRRSKQ